MNLKKRWINLLIKGIVLVLFLTLLIFLIVMKSDSEFCEYWTRSFGQWYQYSFGNIFKYCAWSLTEVFFIVIVSLGITLLVFAIIRLIKKQWLKAISHFLSICLIVVCTLTTYQATAEMAYNRAEMPIVLYEEKVEKSEFEEIVNFFIDDMNCCLNQLTIQENGEIEMPYTLGEMNLLLENEYKKLTDPYFNSYTTYVKPMMSSLIYREFHITGVTFTPLTEANINYLSTNVLKPLTYAHEIAHTKGILRENDANLLASYLMLTSDIPYFRYSGYYNTIFSLMEVLKYVYNEDTYMNALQRIDEKFFINNKFNTEYWNAHKSGLDFAEWVNNLYLKMSGVNNGTQSYNETPAVIDEEKEEIITFSTYQKLMFQIYYNK